MLVEDPIKQQRKPTSVVVVGTSHFDPSVLKAVRAELLARRIEAITADCGDSELSAKAIVIDPLGRVLILKDAHSDWNDIPGGHVHNGEDAVTGLAREVREETGVTIGDIKSLETITLKLGRKERPVQFFTASALTLNVTLSHEHEDFEWADPNDLTRFNLGVLLEPLQRALGIKKLEPVKSEDATRPNHHEVARAMAQKIYQHEIDDWLTQLNSKLMVALFGHKDGKHDEEWMGIYFPMESLWPVVMKNAAYKAYGVTAATLGHALGVSLNPSPEAIKTFVQARGGPLSSFPVAVKTKLEASLKRGVANGESPEALARRANEAFEEISKGQATRVAATEAQATYGVSQAEALELAGYRLKVWVTVGDERVRDSHFLCEEQGAVPVKSPFHNGLMFPGDPNGPPEEVINCRCNLEGAGAGGPVWASEDQGHKFHGNQWTNHHEILLTSHIEEPLRELFKSVKLAQRKIETSSNESGTISRNLNPQQAGAATRAYRAFRAKYKELHPEDVHEIGLSSQHSNFDVAELELIRSGKIEASEKGHTAGHVFYGNQWTHTSFHTLTGEPTVVTVDVSKISDDEKEALKRHVEHGRATWAAGTVSDADPSSFRDRITSAVQKLEKKGLLHGRTVNTSSNSNSPSGKTSFKAKLFSPTKAGNAFHDWITSKGSVQAAEINYSVFNKNAGKFDESKHLRNPEGSKHGGQFTKKPEPIAYGFNPLNTADMTKIGGKLGGTSEAAQWQAKDGTVWYVKEPKSEHHARNEVLAARLYNAAGVRTAEVQFIKDGGVLKLASRVVPTLGQAGAETPGATEGFAADAWLANWDVVGANNDNLLINDHGEALRLDTGGAMFYRAQGGTKGSLFGKDVGEINSLRDPSGKNLKAASVFGEMTPQDVKASILNTVAKVTDKQIFDIVASVAMDGLDGNMPPQIILLLKERRDALIALTKDVPKTIVAAGPKVAGTLFSEANPLFNSGGFDKIFTPEFEKKPKLPTGPQIRCMAEGGPKRDHFTLDNWDDEAHPRPDRDGVPTNPKSMEFMRLFQVGKSQCSDWKGSAQGNQASALKRAAIRVFNCNGQVFGNSQNDDEKTRWDNDRAVRMMYRDTQERMAAKGVTDKDRILLFRGVKQQVIVSGAIEGHSLNKDKAASFNGHDTIKRWVHPTEVLADNASAYFEGTGYGSEKEWLVFAGGFGSPFSHTGSVKDVDKHVQVASKIVNYSTGKKIVKTPLKSVQIVGSIGHPKPGTPVPHSTPSAVNTEKPASAMTDNDILYIKQLIMAGKSTGAIKKATGFGSPAIITVATMSSKKAAQVGPRLPGIKKRLGGISEEKYAAVKADVAEHMKKYATFKVDELALKHGLSHWKIRTIAFAKKKEQVSI